MSPQTQLLLFQFMPELLLLIGGLLFMIAALVDREAGDQPRIKLAALILACGTALFAAGVFALRHKGMQTAASLPGAFGSAAGGGSFISLTQDGFAAGFKLVILIGLALSVLLTCKDEDLHDRPSAEYYALMFFAALGMCVMAAGRDLLTLWIGLETMALATYALIALPRGDRKAPEGAMKYFILGTLSSGVFLYGASLLYGATGSYQLAGANGLAARLPALFVPGAPAAAHSLAVLGTALILIALLFKVAAVPFHMWLPDAYTGAPTAITNFMSVSVKAASFAMLLRILHEGLAAASSVWLPLLAAAAALTMVWGNVAAVRQDNVKRMLAYSSIAHAGYVLTGVVALGATGNFPGPGMVWLYLLFYTFMNSAAFGILIWMRGNGLNGESFEDYAGLRDRAPVLTYLILYVMLALTGIPATAGFIAKWAVFGAAINSHYYGLAAIGLLASAISLFYYFRLVVQMLVKPAGDRPRPAFSWPVAVVVLIGAAATLGWGIFPERNFAMARDLVTLGGDELTGPVGQRPAQPLPGLPPELTPTILLPAEPPAASAHPPA